MPVASEVECDRIRTPPGGGGGKQRTILWVRLVLVHLHLYHRAGQLQVGHAGSGRPGWRGHRCRGVMILAGKAELSSASKIEKTSETGYGLDIIRV